MRNVACLLLVFFIQQVCFAQDTLNRSADSSDVLQQVIVTAFQQNRSPDRATSSVGVIGVQSDRSNKTSVLGAINTIAGVRMEERSPASYRISIRGSSLRSPFGVRNVKVYWNGIPVTDPGGNTYFNQLAWNNFSSLEVFKGPAGSMYGAGTGGLILLNSFLRDWHPGISLEYIGGSYGLNNILAEGNFGDSDRRNTITYAHAQSDGYRLHTRSRKDNASFVSRLSFSDRQQLTAMILFDDLYYETPGGLTAAEFAANPKQARPAAGPSPSAEQAHAAIYQKNFLAGLFNESQFTESLKNSTSIYAAFAQVKNPTFRNYERRNEPHFGGRSVFTYGKAIGSNSFQVVAGGEWQQGFFNTQVSKNRAGNPDTLQTNDDVRYTNYSVFVQGDGVIQQQWYLTAGASITRSDVRFSRLNRYPVVSQHRAYRSEWSPRVAVLRMIGGNSGVYGSVSRGFSPPTVAELLPSTGNISTFLEAEEGLSYEAGVRTWLWHRQLRIEATAFYFKLNNALVVRKDSSNADYYVNAGNTKQRGVELSIDYRKNFPGASPVSYISIATAQTLNNFKYGDFKKDAADYSDKKLPGVPQYTLSIVADVHSRAGIYISVTLYSASKIYLNDANSASSEAYNLLGCRAGWKPSRFRKLQWNFYAGMDNVLDESYSLGNDINAAGGRYYNAAAGRNYYAGIAFGFGTR